MLTCCTEDSLIYGYILQGEYRFKKELSYLALKEFNPQIANKYDPYYITRGS